MASLAVNRGVPEHKQVPVFSEMSSEALALVTVQLVEKILKGSEGDQSIEVKDLKTKTVGGKNDNYGSEMIRASVKYSRNNSGRTVMETISVIFKISLMTEGATKELVKEFESFKLEISMMQTTLAQMNDILKENNYRLSPRLLYAEIGDPSFLVMEDLAPLGYRMADRLIGLDLEHSLLLMKNLAKFHASSVALCEKDPKPKTLYDKGIFHADRPQSFKQFCVGGMKSFANDLRKWPELGNDGLNYSEKLLKFSEVCYDKAVEAVALKQDEFNVINHGDCWVNNMLFRYDDEGKITDHIFLDFQQPLWHSPAIDLVNVFTSSLAEDVDLHHREDLLNEYLNMLTNTMSRLRCRTKPPTMEALEKSLKDYELCSVMATCLFLPIIRLDKGKVANFNEMMQTDVFVNPTYKEQSYRKIVLRRLPVWIARGLIDS